LDKEEKESRIKILEKRRQEELMLEKRRIEEAREHKALCAIQKQLLGQAQTEFCKRRRFD